jgi:hypothetical protein
VGDESHIVSFLDRVRRKHGAASGTASHDISVITKDAESLTSDRTSSHVENDGKLLTSNLEQVGDHQKKTLGGSVSAHEGADSSTTVDGTSGTSLRLHLSNFDSLAENVLTALSSPGISVLTHGAAGSDGEDESHITQSVRDMCSRVVCINAHKSLHFFV